MPAFVVYAVRTRAQVRKAPGFLTGALLADRSWTFWTLTAWDNQESMRAYMLAGAHKESMPYLMRWCDEASVAHWTQESSTLPGWPEANRRMRAEGRVSKVLHPSATHAGLRYREPRVTGSAPIEPA